jgi:putative heme-binding domain-containing protein
MTPVATAFVPEFTECDEFSWRRATPVVSEAVAGENPTSHDVWTVGAKRSMMPRNLVRLVSSLLAVLLITIVGSAEQGPAQQGPATPPLPAPRGTLSLSPEQTAEILKSVKAPAGFTVTAFAGPPIVNYPTCVTATHDNVVFVCVDRNGSLQADPGMGYVLRIVDRDQDGRADEYSVFATMDSPRGAVFDGETLYVSHPPFVTAHRDTNGDGIADEQRTLVRGLGFGLDFRGADHTTNALEMGIDGWLYVAVGDYGFVKAVGADGHEIQLRGGGNVRVRPDGTDLEIYTRGTRNDYDLAIDPYLNLFARGNTNDGGGFDIRLYHFVAGTNFGYPSLFRNFSDEVVPPIADYGTGSGTGMLYVHDAGLPSPFGDALYSVDWGRNAIFRHPLRPRGSTFTVEQEEFVTVPRPNDMAVDGSSNLYVASWAGGQFRYAGDNVGYLVRLTHARATPVTAGDIERATDQRLVELIASANLVHSRAAQAVLVRRGRSADRMSLLQARAVGGPLYGRVAAIFTLKQLAGSDASAALVTLAADPAVRAFALRALADRRGELAGVPSALFVDALSSPDPRVQIEGITGLRRLGAADAAAAILPLTASADVVVSNVAINAMAALGSVTAPIAALKGSSDAVAAGALRVLQLVHQPAVVSGLIAALSDSPTPARRAGILQALARLANRDGVWRGTLAEWWGTRPDTTGPYYDPVAWEESARIRAVLTTALLQTVATAGAQADAARLISDLERNRVLPAGSASLLTAMAADRHPEFDQVARALVGRVRLDVTGTTSELLARVARANARYRTAVVQMVVAAGPPSAGALAILQPAALDTTLSAEARASAFTSLASVAGPDGTRRSMETFAVLTLTPALDAPLEAVWTQFTSAPGHAANVPAFREFAGSGDVARQRLGYVVLLRLAADPPAPGRAGGRGGGGGGGRGRGGPSAEAVQAARAESRQIIDAAWGGPSAASLVWAVGRVGAVTYASRVEAEANAPDVAMREAVAFARSRLTAAAPAVAAAPPSGAVVSAVPYEELLGRLAAVTGEVAVGRRVFEQQACAACHTTTAAEPEKGPYLGGIFTRYSRAEVLESIARPSVRVAQGFATNTFTTTDGRQLAGFVIREGQDDVVIRDLTGAETTLRKAQISSRQVMEGSTMPPGLVDGITLPELASLLAFLESTTPK